MGAQQGKVLILNAEESLLFNSSLALRNNYEEIVTEYQPRHLENLLGKEHFDVIVLDVNFSFGLTGGKESIKILQRIFNFYPAAQVLVTADYSETDVALQAIELGAQDYLIKPWSKEKLLASVNLLYQIGQIKARNKRLKQAPQVNSLDHSIDQVFFEGRSKLKLAFEQSLQKIPSTNHVLLHGETGTEPHIIAKKIHESTGSKGRFIALDLADIAQEDHLKQLFGGDDSDEEKVSLVEMTNGGCLFLKNVECMSLNAQAKLLDILQFNEFKPEQGHRSSRIEVRFMVSSTYTLATLRKNEDCKQDLLQLLSQTVISIPTLRERMEDIEPMTRYLLKQYSKRYLRNAFRLNETTIEALRAYHWPGNYRELRLVTERAAQISKSHLLAPNDFLNIDQMAQDQEALLNMDALEKTAIQDAIKSCDGNLTQAAKTLGLGRSTLYRKMTKYKL